MKKVLIFLTAICLLLCSCNVSVNNGTAPSSTEAQDVSIVGKWIDTETEQIVEYTASGFYYEYINESFKTDKTRYTTENGKIYYFLDGDEPDMAAGIDYEVKDGQLVIAGVIVYEPMTLKTSAEE